MKGNIKKIVGVAAGKGGVGKSTVTANLALALTELGLNVGVLDADLYGPSLPNMLPAVEPASHEGSWVIPAQTQGGIKLISLASFYPTTAAVRAPIANQLIQRFFHGVDWGNLDLLLVDFPPGTGDIQLTLLQEGAFSGVVLVATPQKIACLDVEKTVELVRAMKVPIFGVIENMSYFVPPGSQEKLPLFGQGGVELLSLQYGIPLLGSLPIDPKVAKAADTGQSIFCEEDVSGYQTEFFNLINLLLENLEERQNDLMCELLEEGKGLKITWQDGLSKQYPAHFLQNRCLCQKCQVAQASASLSEALHIGALKQVGSYGVKLLFSSGCSMGIYPFELLRSWESVE